MKSQILFRLNRKSDLIDRLKSLPKTISGSVPLMLVFLFLSVGSVFAGTTTLTWNAPTSNMDGTPLSDLSGYKIYYGTASGVYGSPLDVGNQTSYTFNSLGTGTYYFAVSAYNASGSESNLSNEIVRTTAQAPVISAVASGNLTNSAATLTWTTNIASDSQVEYGPTSSYGTLSALNSNLVTSHSQTISGLQANTLYHFRVKSSAGGLTTNSSDNTFTTAINPSVPVISSISATNVTTSGAIINWTTSIASDSQVEYGISTSYGSATALNSNMVLQHSQTLTGLQANTTYHFRVQSSSSGGTATSADHTFATAVVVTNGPVISNVSATIITDSGTTISWTTDLLSDSQVLYGTTSALGSTTSLDSVLSGIHIQSLTGLASNTTYHFRVQSSAAGITSISGDNTFTTSASGAVNLNVPNSPATGTTPAVGGCGMIKKTDDGKSPSPGEGADMALLLLISLIRIFFGRIKAPYSGHSISLTTFLAYPITKTYFRSTFVHEKYENRTENGLSVSPNFGIYRLYHILFRQFREFDRGQSGRNPDHAHLERTLPQRRWNNADRPGWLQNSLWYGVRNVSQCG
jgi:hypothetical protein